MNFYFLTLKDVLNIHQQLINNHGGHPGIRDIKLLDSALNYPKATFNQEYVHRDIYHMAAAYVFGIIKNHPFIDGNKRTGFVVVVSFLAYNGIGLNSKEPELYELIMNIAQSHISEDNVALFFKNNTYYRESIS